MKYCIIYYLTLLTVLKQINSILLLLIIVMAQFGHYCYNMYQVHEAKEAARLQILKKLPENYLTKIQLSGNTDIRWKEEGKEFSQDGKMYDVVHIKQDGDKVYLYCFNDDDETGALQKLIAAEKDGFDNCSKNPKQKYFENKVTTPDWIFEVQEINNNCGFLTDIIKNSFTHKPGLSRGNFQKIYSPPDFII